MTWSPNARPWLNAPLDTHENSRFERVVFSTDGQVLVELSTPTGPQLFSLSVRDGSIGGRWPMQLGVTVLDGLTVRAGRAVVDGRGHAYPLVLYEAFPSVEIVRELGRVTYCYDLASSRDGTLVAVGGFHTIELWSLDVGRPRFRAQVGGGVVDRVAISPDTRFVACRSRADITLWDTASGELIARTERLVGPSCDVRFSPDGRWLASGWDASRTGLWSVPDLHPRSLVTEGYQRALAWSEDGRWLAIGGQGPSVHLAPIDLDVEPITLPTSGVVNAIAFAPGSRQLAAAVGQRVFLWRQGEPHALSATMLQPDVRVVLDPATLPGAVPLPRSVEELEVRLAEVRWFAAVGQTSQWDDQCERLQKWDDWPGIDSAAVDSMHHDEQTSFEAIVRASRTLARPQVLELIERVRVGALLAMSTSYEPSGDDDDDYAPGDICQAQAAFVMATIAGFLELGWVVPPDLEERWAWYAAGHWPCGYALGERPHRPPFRLLVL